MHTALYKGRKSFYLLFLLYFHLNLYKIYLGYLFIHSLLQKKIIFTKTLQKILAKITREETR